MIGGSRRSSALGSLPSAVSGGLRALCKAAAPRLARGLEVFVCRSTPGNQGAQWLLQVRPRGEIQGTRNSAIGDSVSPSGGWGRERTALPNWVLLEPRGFGSLGGSSTRARGNGSWLRESGARDPGPRRTPGTPGQRDALVSPCRPQSPPLHSGGVGFCHPAQAPRLPGRGPWGQGVVLGGAAGGVWAGGVALLLGDQGGGALLF